MKIVDILIGIGVLFGIIFIQHISIAKLETKMTQIEKNSKITMENAEKAQKTAINSMVLSNKESNELMRTKVSPECTAAVTWGIQQAREFKR